MITICNAIIVKFNKTTDQFVVENPHLFETVTFPVSAFIGNLFKYDIEFTNKFISSVSHDDKNKPDIIITESALKRMESIIEFNRVDS